MLERTLESISEKEELARRTQELERQTKELEAIELRDELTGLFRREHFNAEIEKAFTLANHEQNILSVGFIDIDHFKSINDNYGHGVGDIVITNISEVLRSNVRGDDILARFGGEEFIVLMRTNQPDESYHVMERLLANVRAHSINLSDEQQIQTTVSIGVANHVAGSNAFQTASALIDSADQAMYAAKRNGRDRIVVYSEL